MPANHYINDQDKVITTTWDGDATDSDFIEALGKYLNDIQEKPEYRDYDEIIDLRTMSRIRLSAKGLINIGKLASTTDERRTNTKLAIIVGSDLAFNFAKLYATYRNFGKANKKRLRVVRNEQDAINWLHTNT